MDGWIDEWLEGKLPGIFGLMNVWTIEWMQPWIEDCMNGWMDGGMN